ncbi:hypothetical protein AVEN_41501-1 [Araneus ventricosus]|uniref:Uncharacterized protein n=1 Tax=Araneus ventricosus TaxID=182803 RepID=A0A4Y2HBW2_ARAVE|nr:hypothetical protein AVEN_41501-1 [Araneus ventricosus]
MLLICKILDTLPQEYRSFKSSWLLLNDDKRTTDELTIQLCTQERENKEEKLIGDVQNQEALEAKATKNKTLYKRKANWKVQLLSPKWFGGSFTLAVTNSETLG